MNVNAVAEFKPFNCKVDFWFYLENDKRAVAEPVIFKQHQDGECIAPSMSMNTECAQVLMDELWRCGLRPSEGTGSAGALRAVENHLKDMQKIVFEKVKT